MITTFASLACSRCATAGAAKPEKIGTWIAPMCAIACDATATSGDIGRKMPTRSPGSTPSETRCSASRVTSRESSANVTSRRLPSSRSPTAAMRVRPGHGPAVHAVVRDVQRRADEPGRPRGAARVVEHLRPGLRELEPQVLDASGQNQAGSSLRAAHELAEIGDAGPAHEAGRIRMLDRRPVGAPNDLAHGAPPYGLHPLRRR